MKIDERRKAKDNMLSAMSQDRLSVQQKYIRSKKDVKGECPKGQESLQGAT